MKAVLRQRIPNRSLSVVCATGVFSLSSNLMRGLAVPLWCVHSGIPSGLIGVIMAAGALVPLLLSIQGGALIDKIGIRRGLIGLATISIILVPVFPLTSAVIPLILLQICVGAAGSFSWIAAQTALARLAQGNPRRAGQFSFVTSIGNLGGPALVGVIWQVLGPMAAFDFISFWGVCLMISALLLPKTEMGRLPGLEFGSSRPGLPEFTAYKRAFRMLRIPGVSMVIFVSFLRISVVAILISFYAIALRYVGQPEGHIGLLIGVTGLSSGLATLLATRLKRFAGSLSLVLFGGVGLSIVSIAVTPLLHAFPALFVAAVAYGVGSGIAFPLLLSILSANTAREDQGIAVGLRGTANRVASLIIPLILGGIVEYLGIAWSFYIMGFVLLTLLVIGRWFIAK